MDEQRIDQLAEKWFKETITGDEVRELEAWYATYDNLELEVNSDPDKEALSGRMFKQISERAGLHAFGRSQKVLWSRIAAAAVIVICIGFGYYFYQKGDRYAASMIAANHIAPGKNSGTLVLSDGTKINLSQAVNGRLAERAGVIISKIKAGQVAYTPKNTKTTTELKYNTLFTARGEQYNIVLPDGSKVWLNAASSIRFPETFAPLLPRKVELRGEAYFEIAKSFDKLRMTKRPFIVVTDKQEVEVLGTHFNINSYDDEPDVKTTLLEGSVKISDLNSSTSTLLKPGQQAINTLHNIQVVEANVSEAVAWKNGEFIFREENLQSVLRKISRWYNVDVVYESGVLKNVVLGGYISRSLSLSAVIELMERTGDVHFKVEGRKITVLP